jgi:hypothetical protein
VITGEPDMSGVGVDVLDIDKPLGRTVPTSDEGAVVQADVETARRMNAQGVLTLPGIDPTARSKGRDIYPDAVVAGLQVQSDSPRWPFVELGEELDLVASFAPVDGEGTQSSRITARSPVCIQASSSIASRNSSISRG